MARTLAERLQAAWGQSVVIENRPGAGCNVGAAMAARAAPDGYTLMVGTDALMTSNVHLYKSMPFDPVKDFAPIAMAGAKSSVSRCMRRAGQDGAGADRLRQGQSRQAELRHARRSLAASSVRRTARAQGRHRDRARALSRRRSGGERSDRRPYPDGVSVAVLGGAAAADRQDQDRRAGREDAATPAMPDVPTIGETVPGFEMSSWLGVFAPAATPAPLVARLNDTITKIFNDPPVKEKLAALGLVVGPITRARARRNDQAGHRVRAALIKAANIQPQ